MSVTTERIIYESRDLITGLTDVKITIYNASNSAVVSLGTMSELGSGLYYYDYTPVTSGWHAWIADSNSEPSIQSGKFLSDYSTVSSTSSTATAYATTIQLARFLGALRSIPDIDPAGSSRAREVIGVGDNSNLLFYTDYGRILASSYNFYYGATESAALSNPLTETTHFTLDKDTGAITLTSAGKTAIGTNNIYGDYYFCAEPEMTNTMLQDVINRAAADIDKTTNNHFAVGTDTTPDYNIISDEIHDGKSNVNFNYFTRNYPLAPLSTQLNGVSTASASTLTVDSTAGFPSSGVIGIEANKITYTGKTGTTFTGCSGSSDAHADNSFVYPYVMEVSVSDPGSSPTWTILTPGQDYGVNFKSGRFQLQSGQAPNSGTLNSYPPYNIAGRVRLNYVWGTDSIPLDIVRLTLMMAAKELIYGNMSKGSIRATTNFQEIQNNIDSVWIDKTISQHLNNRSSVI